MGSSELLSGCLIGYRALCIKFGCNNGWRERGMADKLGIVGIMVLYTGRVGGGVGIDKFLNTSGFSSHLDFLKGGAKQQLTSQQ